MTDEQPFITDPITVGVGGKILWEAAAPSVGDRLARVLIERDDSGLLWMTTIYPDLFRDDAEASISVNILEEDLARLSLRLVGMDLE